jgi:hypothetical protein
MSSTPDTDILSNSDIPQAVVSRIEISSLAEPKANTAKNTIGQQIMGPHAYILTWYRIKKGENRLGNVHRIKIRIDARGIKQQ